MIWYSPTSISDRAAAEAEIAAERAVEQEEAGEAEAGVVSLQQQLTGLILILAFKY
jgi:hypothetical protein